MSAKYTQIRTFTGKLIDPFNLKVEDIDIRDIAHALSQMPRFAGHLKHFYSVAQHSLRCFEIACSQGANRDIILEVLLHDAPEAYIMDMPSPVKWRIAGYQETEEHIMKVIAERFKLDFGPKETAAIKRIDETALNEELSALMFEEMPCGEYYVKSRFMTMQEVELNFLNYFAIWKRNL